jgi:hypothetical protein
LAASYFGISPYKTVFFITYFFCYKILGGIGGVHCPANSGGVGEYVTVWGVEISMVWLLFTLDREAASTKCRFEGFSSRNVLNSHFAVDYTSFGAFLEPTCRCIITA